LVYGSSSPRECFFSLLLGSSITFPESEMICHCLDVIN
jgi:hypothetical protein